MPCVADRSIPMCGPVPHSELGLKIVIEVFMSFIKNLKLILCPAAIVGCITICQTPSVFAAQSCSEIFAQPPRIKIWNPLDVPWIERAIGKLSPPPRPLVNINSPMVAIKPPWQTGDPRDTTQYGIEVFDKSASNPMLALVPKVKYAEVNELLKEMDDAPSYNDGIRLLQRYMKQVGLVETLPVLRLIHGSDASPAEIKQHGLLSSRELASRGMSHSRWGQNMGDGIYFYGMESWSNHSTWGGYQYVVTYENVSIIRGSNIFLAGFVKIYDSFRGKYGLPRYADDSLMVPGLPQGALTYHGHIARLPWIYQDLGVVGVSSSLEILIKARNIPANQISVYDLSRGILRPL